MAAPRGYVEARAALANLDLRLAEVLVGQVDAASLHGAVVRAELDCKRGAATVDRQRLVAALERHGNWRYLQRVLVAHRALDGDPLPALRAYLDRFGNALELWLDLLRLGAPEHPWFDDMLARLAGELAALPHLRVLWVIVAALADGDESTAASDEVERVFEAQLRW